ncbi:GEVED domain-containing protein [Dokdonella sp.]|uniref:DUF7933 domain-containing protein n=1 Tax=Dokdonella sp. TaxID=2291710 RepID=UPI001B20843A|nr:GEVED domain-containing protein [Dokdonella sp.]MBO9663964.1 hypothetical protein [Dokdonella sp.]
MSRLTSALAALGLLFGTTPAAHAATVAPGAGACDNATPGIVVHDDDTVDTGYSLTVWVAHTWEFAEKFTPASYPATFSAACFDFFQSSGLSSLDFEIVVWDDDGVDGMPGTELGRLAATAAPIGDQSGTTPSFFRFDLTPLALNIDSGSVYVGARLPSTPAGGGFVDIAVDSDGPADASGYDRHDGNGWHPIAAEFPGYKTLFIRAVGGLLGPVAPALTQRFEPELIQPGETSRLHVQLRNISQPTPAVLSADLIDALPAGVFVAAEPNATTSCGGTWTADAGAASVRLLSGAQIPAAGTCEVAVDVTSSVRGRHPNTIAAGALATDHGSNLNPAEATLQVGYLFPQPYCDLPFLWAVEPITHLAFAGIDHASDATIDGSPPLEDFTAFVGDVVPGGTYAMRVEGTTGDTYGHIVSAYVDWNQDGDFFDYGEAYAIGSLVDANEVGQPATAQIAIPADALPGTTRLRIVRDQESFPAVDACYSDNFGQAEDYTLTVTPNTAPTVVKQFAPSVVPAGVPSRLTLTLANPQETVAALTATFTDTFPVGVVVADAPNASTTCADGTLTAAAGSGAVSLAAGAKIPGNGSCAIEVDVQSAIEGRYTNEIPIGALKTDLGDSPFHASAELKIGYTFPEPYCRIDFPGEVDPISRVVFGDVDQASSAEIGASPAIEDFTMVSTRVAPGDSLTMTVEGNTGGNFETFVTAYVDWNGNHSFADPGEAYDIGTLVNSDGSDGQQVRAQILVPASAAPGTTRLRVTKNFGEPANACSTFGYGQAEDYSLIVATPVVDGIFCSGFEDGESGVCGGAHPAPSPRQ